MLNFRSQWFERLTSPVSEDFVFFPCCEMSLGAFAQTMKIVDVTCVRRCCQILMTLLHVVYDDLRLRTRSSCSKLVCIVCATLAFSTMLRSLLPSELSPNSTEIFSIAVIAHYTSVATLKCMQYGFDMSFHITYCQQLTASIAFTVTYIYVSVPSSLLVALLEFTLFPHRFLWSSKTRQMKRQD